MVLRLLRVGVIMACDLLNFLNSRSYIVLSSCIIFEDGLNRFLLNRRVHMNFLHLDSGE